MYILERKEAGIIRWHFDVYVPRELQPVPAI